MIKKTKMCKRNIFFFLFFLPVVLNAQLTASFTYNGANCAGDSIFFSNTSSGNYKLSHWFFGDTTDTWVQNPVHIFLTSGVYNVKLVIIDASGNTNSFSKNITINPKPKVKIIQNAVNKTLIAVSDEKNLTYLWLFNSDTTTETDSVIYYLESGVYSVIVTNGNSCSSKDSIKIDLNSANADEQDSLKIIVKNNILTPSLEDGANDVLFIDGLASYNAPCQVVIFNRWGQIVYRNDNYSNIKGFRGKNNKGRDLVAGTYYYIIKSEGRKTATGYIDIIR